MTVAVVTTPRGAAVTPLTNKTNVANEHSSDVTVVDGATNTIITTVLAGTNPIGVAVNPVTNQIYVGDGGGNDVTGIDRVTKKTTTGAAGGDPRCRAMNTGSEQG